MAIFNRNKINWRRVAEAALAERTSLEQRLAELEAENKRLRKYAADRRELKVTNLKLRQLLARV